MSTVPENPCLACNENQRCCSQLSGLRLSQEEFEKYFKNHSTELTIVKNDKVFIVTSHDNGPCPHWEPDGCRIYHDRPIDCRVYPYEITQVVEKKEAIEIKFRDSPCCPQRDRLLMPREEAEALMRVFGRAVYGPGKPILMKYVQEEKDRPRIFALFEPILERLFRIIRYIGKNG